MAKNDGKMAIRQGMIIFISYHNTSETSLLVLRSLCYHTEEDFSEMLKAGFRENVEQCLKIVKKVKKMAEKWQYDWV